MKMTDRQLQKFVRRAYHWSDPRTPEYRLAQYHRQEAITRYWTSQFPFEYTGSTTPEQPHLAMFGKWCLDTLGYVPKLDDKGARFRSPGDETLFYLRWHHAQD